MVILANKILEYSDDQWNDLDKSKIEDDFWRVVITTESYVKTNSKGIVENAKFVKKLKREKEQRYQEFLKLKQEFEN